MDKIKLILISLFSLFMGIITVNAASVTCEYVNDLGAGVKVSINNFDMELSVIMYDGQQSGEQIGYFPTIDKFLDASDRTVFTCPKEIYRESRKTEVTKYDYTFEALSNSTPLKLRSETDRDTSDPLDLKRVCPYGAYTVFVTNEDKVIGRGYKYVISFDPDAEEAFKTSCLDKIYLQGSGEANINNNYTTYIRIYKTNAAGRFEAQAKTTEEIIKENHDSKSSNSDGKTEDGNIINVKTVDSSDCASLLSEPVQTVVQNIFSFIQYLGPILVIVLTIVDLIKAALSGEQDEIKKVSQKFIKRLIAAVALFFVPMLVNLILELMGVVAPQDCLGIIK